MRKTLAAASILGLAAIALVGCSSQPETPEACGRVADTDASLMGDIAVDGDAGSTLTVDAPEPFVSKSAEHLDLTTGDGPVITSTSQAIVADVTLVDGETGAQLTAAAPAGDLTQVLPIQTFLTAMPGLEDALMCASEGSRVVAALGAGGIEDSYGQQLTSASQQNAMIDQVQGTDTWPGGFDTVDGSRTLVVVDIERVLPASADGSPVYNSGHGMPSVVRTPEGVPGVIVPDGDAPTEQKTQTLLAGDGAEVADRDVVTIQYLSVNWNTKAQTTSTWESGSPATTTLDQLPAGFADAITGATVGSQILTVVPGDDGNATVSVIDVLGSVAAS
ncbi:FKBP-type peptidyl-prolyl cis-trans isomerase [Microbacterium indicum]|uniref:FKBP-type peptidyl-prolyl cis-trans isomerase n=1 Tax=Microbacterium indicum TaxID=358100 RepID=UPI000410908B|nr:hypothetical protein [Microbacterium indicum]